MAIKVCVIVGVGPGIGMAVARRFAREGYHIALVSRDARKLAKYTQQIKEFDGMAHGFPADASDAEGLVGAFNHIKEQMGHPDVLIYNAAVKGRSNLDELEPDDLLDAFRVNVMGAMVCVQQVVDGMKDAGHGTIIFTGGGLALHPAPDYVSLSIGKAGIRSLAYSLHGDLKSSNIHVATVTIGGFVKEGTYFDPDNIAEAYWTLHTQVPEEWETEVIYRES